MSRSILGAAFALCFFAACAEGPTSCPDRSCAFLETYRLYDSDAGCTRVTTDHQHCSEGVGPPCVRCSRDSAGKVYLSPDCRPVPNGSACASGEEVLAVAAAPCP